MTKIGRVCIILIVGSLCALGRLGSAAEPTCGGTLVFGIGSSVSTLDPHQALDRESLQVCGNLYGTLVKYSSEESKLVPGLATSWEAKKESKEWTLHLRKGVMFHDGTSLNADAVVFSFERQLNPNHPYYEENCFYGRYLFAGIIDKVRTVDDYTVSFSLKKSYAPFIYSLTSPAAMIVSPQAVKDYGDDFYRHPAGTGPFKLLSWEENGGVVLERYKDYREEKVYLDILVFRLIAEEYLRIQALTKGEIQVTLVESAAEIKSLAEGADKLTMTAVPHLDVVYLALNMRKVPLNQLKVREAVYRAINREKLPETFYPERAIVARSLIPPTLWGYNPDVAQYGFNPRRTKKLLKEAKVENPILSLWIPESPTSYLPDPEGMAQCIRDDLAQAGIDVEIVKMDWRSYLEGCEQGEHHLALTGWRADFPDPDNFLYPLLDPQVLRNSGNTNWSFYRSPYLHEILERARQVTDEVERTRLYQVAQKIVQQDIPNVPLVHTKGIVVFSPEVEGIARKLYQ